MNLVRIKGPESLVTGLGDVADAALMDATLETLESGEWQIAAYVTDRALAEIESRGATVEVFMDSAALNARYNELFARIDEQGPVA